MSVNNERLVDLKAVTLSLIRAGIWAAIFGVSLHLSSPLFAAVPIFLLFVGTKHLSLQVERLRDDNFQLRIAIVNYLIAKQVEDLAELEQGEFDIGIEHRANTKATSNIDIESLVG